MSDTKVFISYSRSDYLNDKNEPIKDSAVAVILNSLESNNIEAWVDTNSHYSGKFFTSELAKKILWADKVLFISSEASNKSEWVCQEILYAYENKKTIIPIKIDDSPFSENFALVLSGIDYIEYYKNPTNGIDKTVKLLTGNGINVTETSKDNSLNVLSYLKVIGICLLIFLCVFCFFATIGFGIGYYDTSNDVASVMNEAFRNGQITAVNSHSIKFSGKTMAFTYDIESNNLTMENESSDFFDNITFDKLMVAISIPLAFKNLVKMSKSAGNGKSRAVFLAVGAIGILCGYAIGEPIGRDYAMWKNEKALQDYFKQERTKFMVKLQLKIIYQ